MFLLAQRARGAFLSSLAFIFCDDCEGSLGLLFYYSPFVEGAGAGLFWRRVGCALVRFVIEEIGDFLEFGSVFVFCRVVVPFVAQVTWAIGEARQRLHFLHLAD